MKLLKKKQAVRNIEGIIKANNEGIALIEYFKGIDRLTDQEKEQISNLEHLLRDQNIFFEKLNQELKVKTL